MIVITSVGTGVKIDLNAVPNNLNRFSFLEAIFCKDDINVFLLKNDEGVRIFFKFLNEFHVVTFAEFGTVDGVAPVSNTDLFNKLASLLTT